MIETNLRNRAYHYELAGAITCASFLACVQGFLYRWDWLVTPVRPLTLIKYLCLDLICYLVALFIIRRYWLVAVVPITSFVATAIIGSMLSAIVVGLPFVLNHWGSAQLTGGRIGELCQKSIYFVVLNCFLTIPIMVIFYWIGSKLRGVQKLSGRCIYLTAASNNSFNASGNSSDVIR
jgi:hypothetical protein